MHWMYAGFAVVFSLTSMAHNNGSLSDLLSSPDVFATESEAAAFESTLWNTYLSASNQDAQRKAQHDRRELRYGDKVMKFSLDRIGNKPSNGYPVYIALHGGGGAPSSVNDSQWQHMKIYYKDSVKNGIYVAPRGITDTWNLHFRDESYPLYDRLIENLIAYEGADPNRIYLLGFSAGGDGVYQIVPRMPDRFAAANMSAGHHNWIEFDNLYNTPFLIQVGERDTAYNRHHVGAENHLKLNELNARHGGGYIHDAFIHYNGSHNSWRDNNAQSPKYSVIKDPHKWRYENDRTTIQVNTNAIDWLKRYERATPKKIIWDLKTRAPRTTTWGKAYVDANAAIEASADLFYWLKLDDNDVKDGRIEAEIKPEENAIYLSNVSGVKNLRILLHRALFDFTRPVTVYLNNQKLSETTPALRVSVMTRTLLERGDPALLFHDELSVSIPSLSALTASNDQFSYCSNGRCSLMSADHFRRVRNFPETIAYTCKKDNHYALTFDDGPTSNWETVLAILEQHNVPATFFVVGKNLETETGREWVQKAYAKGHDIANHSFTHPSLIKLSDVQIAHELIQTQNNILAALGDTKRSRRASSIVRPPFGDIDDHVEAIAHHHGFSTVRWNSDRYDWQLSEADGPLVKQRVLDHLRFVNNAAGHAPFNRSIIDVNHDKSQATVSVLNEIIPLIKEAGYEFVTISECLDAE